MNAMVGVGIVALIIYELVVDNTYLKIYLACLFIYYLLTHIIFVNHKDITKRKKLGIATWNTPGDPTAYIPTDFDVTKTLKYIEKINKEQKDVKITMTHIFSRAMGLAQSKNRRDIGRIRWGNFQQAEIQQITILVDYDGGKDLVPVTLQEPQQMDIVEMAKIIQEWVQRIKVKKDHAYNKTTFAADYLPTFLIGPMQAGVAYISQNCGLPVNLFGVKANAWGHGVLTNIGSIGMTEGFAPIPTPLYPQYVICIGKVEKKPIVLEAQNAGEEDKIIIRPILRGIFTYDHRFGDAATTLKFAKMIKHYVEDPEGFDINSYSDSIPYHIEEKMRLEKLKQEQNKKD